MQADHVPHREPRAPAAMHRSVVLDHLSSTTKGSADHGAGVRSASDLDDLEFRIEAAKIVGVRRQHSLSCTTSADDDMSVDYFGSARGSQQTPDVRGVHAVEGDDIGVRLAEQAGEADLALGPPDRLSECSCRHGETSPDFGRSCQQHDDGANIPVDS
ncbi:MAG: hypothetical protein ACT4PX_05725, partial [Actinomycetota bacterium]